MRAEDYPLPAIASILEMQFPDGSFRDAVREELYREFPFREGIKGDREGWNAYIKFVQEQNPTMSAVMSFCSLPRFDDQGQELYMRRPNRRIHAVVNFNLDTAFWEYAYRLNYGGILRIIVGPEIGSSQDDPSQVPLNVYHIHGCLPFDETPPGLDKSFLGVFTEQSYFDFFNQPNSMFHYTCLYLLRAHSCLFIGLSLKDENIRRLLHYSQMELEQGSTRRKTKPGTTGETDEVEEVHVRHYAIMKHSPYARIDELTVASLKRLGTEVLWIDDFDEIPNRLGELYSTAGDDWGVVYHSVS